jgi:predicted ArsR family transcriptional regulator
VQVLKLREEECLTIAQIAQKLGICEKTAKLDLKKLNPYYERMSRHYEDFLRSRLHD